MIECFFMMEWLRENKHLIPVLILFCIMQIALYAPRLSSDGAYYYEFARSLTMQNDLNFDDEREFFTWFWVPVFRDYIRGNWIDTGYPPNIFSIGPAIVWIPVMMAVHLAVNLAAKTGFQFSESGYGLAYRFPVTMVSVLAGIFILAILDRLMKQAEFRASSRGFALLLILGASHIPAFLFVTPAFSHALSTLASCLFFYIWYRSRDAGWSEGGFACYGIFAGFMVLARWQNLFTWILPAIDMAAALKFAPTRPFFVKRLRRWSAFWAAALLTITPQLIVTWILYGKPITDPQGSGGMRWMDPWFGLVLFDGLKGLFTVNPVLLIATLGLPFAFKRSWRLGWGTTLLFMIHLYINAVRRDWSGVGFGMRRFLDLLPVFTIGLAVLYDMPAGRIHRIFRWSLTSAGLLLMGYNLLLMGQYYFTDLGAPWSMIPPGLVLHRQLTEAPGCLIQLIQSGLCGHIFTGHHLETTLGVLAVLITLCLIPFIFRIANRLTSVCRKPAMMLTITAGMLIFMDSWIYLSAKTTRLFKIVDLNPGPRFGFLRNLRVNPVLGYQGAAGGIRFNADGTTCLLEAGKQYDPDRFLKPGRLILREKMPCYDREFVELYFPGNDRFAGMVLISHVSGDSEPQNGTQIAEIQIGTDDGKELLLPVIQGIHTGRTVPAVIPASTVVLQRDLSYGPPSPVGFQARYSFAEPIFIRNIRIQRLDSAYTWTLEGLAFETSA